MIKVGDKVRYTGSLEEILDCIGVVDELDEYGKSCFANVRFGNDDVYRIIAENLELVEPKDELEAAPETTPETIDQFDPVNHPMHYCNGEIECIEAMEIIFGKEAVKIFCELSAFKYRWRAPFKGQMEQDIKKADRCLKKAREYDREAAGVGG